MWQSPILNYDSFSSHVSQPPSVTVIRTWRDEDAIIKYKTYRHFMTFKIFIKINYLQHFITFLHFRPLWLFNRENLAWCHFSPRTNRARHTAEALACWQCEGKNLIWKRCRASSSPVSWQGLDEIEWEIEHPLFVKCCCEFKSRKAACIILIVKLHQIHP